jgi:D-hydroxyproline dehydrogenase subunit alpha
MATTDLAVVGAGPAGLAAAIAAAKAGVRVTLVDEYARPGGQYLKGAHHSAGLPRALATERKGHALLDQLSGLDIELRTETLVWGIEGLRLALAHSGALDWLEADAVIVATGARELVVPFPGWTLPGVMTLGAAQVLAKEHGVAPGKRVLLAGTGPLLLPAVNQLTTLGAQVVAILEATRPGGWVAHAPALWGNWDRLREGWYYLNRLRQAKAPYRFGRTVIRAIGENELRAVIVARLDRQGRPIPGSEETVPVDTLCLGFGFLPNVELTQLAGCAHEYDATRGGWAPRMNEQMETSQAGLFAAGEAAGVAGASAAMSEGRIAGLAAAHRLGYVRQEELARELDRARPIRRRLRRFGGMLNTLFSPPPGLDSITTDDTIICRCEDITAGQVRAIAKQGAGELDALKTWTRVGQGPCQGRTCGPLLARWVAREIGCSMQAAGQFHTRPPLKPLTLGDLRKEAA